MPIRSPILAIDEVYHVFNRTVGNEEVFSSRRNLGKAIDVIDYYRFLQRIRYSKFRTLPKEQKESYLSSIKNQKPLADIFCFSFMANHYHLLLKQLKEDGILKFISNFQNSFAKYFNLKNNRHGTLFQNSFKAKRVETEEEFLHISRYIHLNPVTSLLIEFKDLAFYPWTSFPWYIEEEENRFVNTTPILENFKIKKQYQNFHSDQVDYQRKLHLIKNLILE